MIDDHRLLLTAGGDSAICVGLSIPPARTGAKYPGCYTLKEQE
jgi:hypothetical protein